MTAKQPASVPTSVIIVTVEISCAPLLAKERTPEVTNEPATNASNVLSNPRTSRANAVKPEAARPSAIRRLTPSRSLLQRSLLAGFPVVAAATRRRAEPCVRVLFGERDAGDPAAFRQQLVLDLYVPCDRIRLAKLLVVEIFAGRPRHRSSLVASQAWVTCAFCMLPGADGPPILVGTQPGSSALDKTFFQRR